MLCGDILIKHYIDIKHISFKTYKTLNPGQLGTKWISPSYKITTCLRHGISRISTLSFKMNKQWKLIAKSNQKQYVHANNHIIKAFRGEQTLLGRNDRHNLI